MGRPTNNPKTARLEIRLSEQENELLNKCCKKGGFNRTEAILKGIELLNKQLKEDDNDPG